MTNINIDLARNLDGTHSYMAVAFIDSYGDVLLKTLTLDDIAGDSKLLLDNYFTPCGICGLPVVDSSIVPDTQGMCDHCYKAGPADQYVIKAHTLFGAIPGANIPELMDAHERQEAMLNMLLTQILPEDIKMETKSVATMVVVNNGLDMQQRIEVAVETGETAFWNVIDKSFPEAERGDLDPAISHTLSQTLLKAVEQWVELNVPRQDVRTQPISDLNVHYKGIWYMINSDIGCPVVVSDNIERYGKHYYIAMDSKSVSIHEDDFKKTLLFNEQIEWFFGDNPTVLMNYLDEYFKPLDNNKLFDDIMTIGKSSIL